MSWRIIWGDSRSCMDDLPERSVHCSVSSPPYFGLRSYRAGSAEIGSEKSVREYIDSLRAEKLGRNSIIIELSADYVEVSRKRLSAIARGRVTSGYL